MLSFSLWSRNSPSFALRYHAGDWYAGWTDDDGTAHRQHADYHNLHQLLWTRSLHEGFARKRLRQRPWSLQRSGTSGLQRYGAAMWSGA